MFEPSAELAIKIEAVTVVLRAISAGGVASYAALSQAARAPIVGGSYVLRQARKQAESDTGALFEVIRNVGVMRLKTQQVVGVGKRANASIRRKARSTRQRLDALRANDLAPTDRVSVAAYRAHFSMLEEIARERTVRELAKDEDKDKPQPSVRDVVERFTLGVKA